MEWSQHQNQNQNERVCNAKCLLLLLLDRAQIIKWQHKCNKNMPNHLFCPRMWSLPVPFQLCRQICTVHTHSCLDMRLWYYLDLCVPFSPESTVWVCVWVRRGFEPLGMQWGHHSIIRHNGKIGRRSCCLTFSKCRTCCIIWVSNCLSNVIQGNVFWLQKRRV